MARIADRGGPYCFGRPDPVVGLDFIWRCHEYRYIFAHTMMWVNRFEEWERVFLPITLNPEGTTNGEKEKETRQEDVLTALRRGLPPGQANP